jgi:hypothetical protein
MSDTQTKAMAAGKSAKRSRTVWTLEIGGTAFRCRNHSGVYIVQCRSKLIHRDWKEYNSIGLDPVVLLRRIAASANIERLLRLPMDMDAEKPG